MVDLVDQNESRLDQILAGRLVSTAGAVDMPEWR